MMYILPFLGFSNSILRKVQNLFLEPVPEVFKTKPRKKMAEATSFFNNYSDLECSFSMSEIHIPCTPPFMPFYCLFISGWILQPPTSPENLFLLKLRHCTEKYTRLAELKRRNKHSLQKRHFWVLLFLQVHLASHSCVRWNESNSL